MDFWNIENSEYWFCSHQFIFPGLGCIQLFRESI